VQNTSVPGSVEQNTSVPGGEGQNTSVPSGVVQNTSVPGGVVQNTCFWLSVVMQNTNADLKEKTFVLSVFKETHDRLQDGKTLCYRGELR